MGWQSCTDKDSFSRCDSGCPGQKNIDFDLEYAAIRIYPKEIRDMLIHGTDGTRGEGSL